MKFINRIIIFVAITFVMFILLLAFERKYNFYWVDATPQSSKITINFLFPMVKGELSNHIHWTNLEGEEEQVAYSLRWINSNTICIENIIPNSITGNDIKLNIDKAPTIFNSISKSQTIIMPFKTEVILLAPKTNTIISSNSGFEVNFNTPINIDTLCKSMESNAEFYIQPVKIQDNGKYIIDFKRFKFIPKKSLINGSSYFIYFKRGIAAVNGELLDNDILINLYVDDKPCIIDSYPKNNSKWIGLYPRFNIKTKTPIATASLVINGSEISGEISKDQTNASFILDGLLDSNKSYTAICTVKSLNGESSEPYTINFTTTSMDDTTMWMKICPGNDSCIECYQGTKKIKTIPCSIGTNGYILKSGTYYLQNKSEVYIDSKGKMMANYWLKISENYSLHGYPRDDYWNVKSNLYEIKSQGSLHENIILLDSDIEWIYKNIPIDAMVILKNINK